MSLFVNFYNSVSDALTFNTATLSGAIDIIVIADPQPRPAPNVTNSLGWSNITPSSSPTMPSLATPSVSPLRPLTTSSFSSPSSSTSSSPFPCPPAFDDSTTTYTCTPFHVRFGKLQLLKSREKLVTIHVNGVKCEYQMKLGHDGQAYFMLDKLNDDEIDSLDAPLSPISPLSPYSPECLSPKSPPSPKSPISTVAPSPTSPTLSNLTDRTISSPDENSPKSPILTSKEADILSSSLPLSNSYIPTRPISPSTSPKAKVVDISSPSGPSPLNTSYTPSLRPTSDMLKKMGFHAGRNTISFSVTSSFQGQQTVSSYAYVWPPTVQLVISDIDGTITKSDILGHLMPLVGRDWSHVGVSALYSQIAKNGYEMVYLTSRAIGQAGLTRSYIHSLRQGIVALPFGPVIMSPDRLLHSFKREVIDRKPQEFKIVALRQIKQLWLDEDYQPFYAGFGNRMTDVVAYRTVGVNVHKIFIINPKGEISAAVNIHYKKSYPEIHTIVDAMFPPLPLHDHHKTYTDVQLTKSNNNNTTTTTTTTLSSNKQSPTGSPIKERGINPPLSRTITTTTSSDDLNANSTILRSMVATANLEKSLNNNLNKVNINNSPTIYPSSVSGIVDITTPISTPLDSPSLMPSIDMISPIPTPMPPLTLTPSSHSSHSSISSSLGSTNLSSIFSPLAPSSVLPSSRVPAHYSRHSLQAEEYNSWKYWKDDIPNVEMYEKEEETEYSDDEGEEYDDYDGNDSTSRTNGSDIEEYESVPSAEKKR